MVRKSKADWSRTLPRPIEIRGVMTLRTLDDVRTLISHLPKEVLARDTWQATLRALSEAALGVATTEWASVSLRHDRWSLWPLASDPRQ